MTSFLTLSLFLGLCLYQASAYVIVCGEDKVCMTEDGETAVVGVLGVSNHPVLPEATANSTKAVLVHTTAFSEEETAKTNAVPAAPENPKLPTVARAYIRGGCGNWMGGAKCPKNYYKSRCKPYCNALRLAGRGLYWATCHFGGTKTCGKDLGRTLCPSRAFYCKCKRDCIARKI